MAELINVNLKYMYMFEVMWEKKGKVQMTRVPENAGSLQTTHKEFAYYLFIYCRGRPASCCTDPLHPYPETEVITDVFTLTRTIGTVLRNCN